jgi:hypothetical protein
MGKRLFHAYHTFRQTVLEMDAIYQSLVGVSLVESTGLFRESASKIPEGIWSARNHTPCHDHCPDRLVRPSYQHRSETSRSDRSLCGRDSVDLRFRSRQQSHGSGTRDCTCSQYEIGRVRGKWHGRSWLWSQHCDRSHRAGETQGRWCLEIGAINSPDAVLISGDGALLNHLVDVAKADGIFARRVQSLVPSHSSLMDSCRKQYLEGVAAVFSRHGGSHRPIIRTYSTVAGQPRITTRFTPEYFWDNLRNPVHFHQGTTSVLDDFPGAVFVEISPHPALSSYIASSVGHNRVLCPMRRPKTPSDTDAEALAFTRTVGDLIVLGVNQIDLTSLYGRSSRDPAYDIPYPFTERYFPMRIDGPRSQSGTLRDGSSLHLQINAKTHPDLAQHVINGEPIMPGAGFLDMVSKIYPRFPRISTKFPISDVSPPIRSCKWARVQCGTWTSRPFFP